MFSEVNFFWVIADSILVRTVPPLPNIARSRGINWTVQTKPACIYKSPCGGGWVGGDTLAGWKVR